jgi:hypothetical protein
MGNEITQARFGGIKGSRPHPLREQIIASVPERILAGERIADIAKTHQVSVPTLQVWLSGCREYHEAQMIVTDARLAEAEEDVRNAEDQVAIARARELLKAAQWHAERRDRRYAAKQETTITHRLDLSEAIEDADARIGRVIDVDN